MYVSSNNPPSSNSTGRDVYVGLLENLSVIYRSPCLILGWYLRALKLSIPVKEWRRFLDSILLSGFHILWCFWSRSNTSSNTFFRTNGFIHQSKVVLNSFAPVGSLGHYRDIVPPFEKAFKQIHCGC